jgi:hypothetical protein
MGDFVKSLVSLCAFLAALTLSQNSFAQSAKSSVAVGNVNILKGTSMAYSTIMSTIIRTSSQKDLSMNVSLECGLLTRTKVSSKNGISDTSSASASVKVRVLVDGKVAKPGEVVFCRRTQELSATFGGIYSNCTDANGDGIISLTECTLDPESVSLMLDTMNANAFNFILDNMGSGSHKVEVQAQIDSGTNVQLGSADANASIGKGSIDVEEIRLIRNQLIDF